VSGREVRKLFEEALAVRQLAAELEGEDLALSLDSETEFTECADKIVGAILDARMKKEAARARARETEGRADMFERQEERLRNLLLSAMQTAGRKTLRCIEGTVTVADGSPKLSILDTGRIPQKYWQIKTDHVVDRVSLLTDLKNGHDIPGATLDNAQPRLTVRVR
jgi:hypothetical protein